MKPVEESRKLWSPAFMRLCGCNVLFFASFNMIIPELPGYLKSMGGEEYIGYIIFLFTLTALISRPFSGKLADELGRVPVMVAGVAISALCGFLYLFTGTVLAFLALRLIHGFSTGFTPTGSSAYVVDIVPVEQRGEAMGLISLSGAVGMAMGPAFGSWLVLNFEYDVLFLVSGILGLLALGWIAGLRETLPERKPFSVSMLRIRFSEFYEPRVVLPALILFLVVSNYGAVLTLIPDRCAALGLENKGSFFAVATIASIFVRFWAGKVSDRVGREKVLLLSTSMMTLAMFLLAFAPTVWILLLGATVYGLANGVNSPTVMAWAVDLCQEKFIGRAISTVFMALELGIGAGALISGGIYTRNHGNFEWIFVGFATLCILAFGLILYRVARNQKS